MHASNKKLGQCHCDSGCAEQANPISSQVDERSNSGNAHCRQREVMVLLKALSPEREIEIELEYFQRKKRKKPDKYFCDLWEGYSILKDHVRNNEGYQRSNCDEV